MAMPSTDKEKRSADADMANRKLRDGVETPTSTACGFAFPRSGHITKVLVRAQSVVSEERVAAYIHACHHR